jgi:hypothetical protein
MSNQPNSESGNVFGESGVAASNEPDAAFAEQESVSAGGTTGHHASRHSGTGADGGVHDKSDRSATGLGGETTNERNRADDFKARTYLAEMFCT